MELERSSSPRTGDPPLEEYWGLHPLSMFVIDEPTKKTIPLTRPLEQVEHACNHRSAPLSFAKKPKTAFERWLGGRIWRGHHPDRLQLRQSPPDVTGTLIGPRGPESASLPLSLHIICRPTAFLPRDHQENSCTGHKPSSGKVRENLTKVLGISTNSRGEVTTSLQKCGLHLNKNNK